VNLLNSDPNALVVGSRWLPDRRRPRRGRYNSPCRRAGIWSVLRRVRFCP